MSDDTNHLSSKERKTVALGPRVLVLAYPELATPICDILERRLSAQCSRTPDDPEVDEDSLAWLCTFLLSASDPEICRFFEWGNYDAIVMQDVWLSGSSASTAGVSLELAGYVFALQDYYERANFRTAKVVIVTDSVYACWRKTNRLPVADKALERVREEFDPKSGLWFVDALSGDFLTDLCDVVQSHSQ